MPSLTISSAVGRAAAFAVALVFVALIAWCSKSSPKYRRMTKSDHCMGMPVHAGPTGPLIGYLIGGALVDPGSGPVQAIDVSVVVDGETRSVNDRDIDRLDRKSTRLNSSHANISYAVFCLKKKKKKYEHTIIIEPQ